MNYLVIYPGRFHPFHLGHKASYEWLTDQFGENSVFIASSGKQNPDDSPFAYADKVKMVTKLGVPSGRIKQVKNPYRAIEITDALSAQEKANTILVFAVSAKDAQRFDFKPRADGSPSYLQPMPANKKSMKPMTQHGYIVVTPTVNFRVQGADANSASQIRKLYTAGNENDRNQIIADLYGESDSELKDIFDQRLGVNKPTEGIIYGQEKIYAGEQETSIMREQRLACLRENILFLQDKIRQLRENHNHDDDIDMSGNYAMSPDGYRSMRRKQMAWAKKPASESPTARFAYQGFTIQFHPDRVEIYHGSDLVYTKTGNYANPTTQQLSTVKSRIPALVAKLKKLVKENSADYVEERWSQKYKRSINCNNPKGFSQRAHCAGRKKK